jgi:hypothetical protein
MEIKDFLGEIHRISLELLKGLKFDKHHALHFGLVSLYSSLIELVGCLIILLNKNGKLGVRPLFRTFLETYVEFKNLAQDPKYGYSIEASDIKEWLKVIKSAQDNNPYLASIAALADLSTKRYELERKLQNLKKKGYEPKSIYDKFKLAGMEMEYRSLYNFMCTETHSNLRALINRHVEINDEDFNVVVYMNPPDESFLPVLDSAAGLLISATIRIHEILRSDAVADAKFLEEGLKEVRTRYESL